MLLLNEFLQRYPEFEQTDTDRIGLFLSDAELEISPARWGKLYKRGVMALSAHLLKLSLSALENQGEANKLIASESAGELSVSYAVTSGQIGDDFYQTTAYGQEYLRLRKLVGVGVMVA